MNQKGHFYVLVGGGGYMTSEVYVLCGICPGGKCPGGTCPVFFCTVTEIYIRHLQKYSVPSSPDRALSMDTKMLLKHF